MDLEPLATHLEPQFGNIYDYGSWTGELKAAVRHYLIEVAPEELYERFLGHIGHNQVPSGSRAAQTDFILDHYGPWGVSAGLHCAAVAITPTLDQVIDQIERVPSGGDRADAALWLTRHATDMQIIHMARDSGRTELLEIRKTSGYRNPDAYDLVAVVPLSQLRVLWGKHQSATPTHDHDVALPPKPSQLRKWGRIHGLHVADVGRIPASVIEAFEAARSSSPMSPTFDD